MTWTPVAIVALMSGEPTYLGAVGKAVAQGAMTAAWIASAELPKAQRRALRFGATAAVWVPAWVAVARDRIEYHYTVGEGLMIRRPDGTEERRPVRTASLAATGASVLFGAGMIIGRERLQKRWLARLERQGHEHPHRALALRMGLLAMAETLGGRLVAAQQAKQAGRRTKEAAHRANEEKD